MDYYCKAELYELLPAYFQLPTFGPKEENPSKNVRKV